MALSRSDAMGFWPCRSASVDLGRPEDLFVSNSEDMAGSPIHRYSYGSSNSPLPCVFWASRNIRSPSPVPM